MVSVDVLRTPSTDSVDLRLGALAEAFDSWLDTYRPDVVAIERVFARNDVSTIMGAALFGLTMGLAARHRAARGDAHALRSRGRHHRFGTGR